MHLVMNYVALSIGNMFCYNLGCIYTLLSGHLRRDHNYEKTITFTVSSLSTRYINVNLAITCTLILAILLDNLPRQNNVLHCLRALSVTERDCVWP